MSDRHGKDAARLSQHQTPHTAQDFMPPPNPPIPPTNGSGFSPIPGEFPSNGRYTVTGLALRLGYSRRTIERYVDEYDIPYRQPGDEMMIDAAEFWANLPVLRRSKSKRPRGGDRRKKE